MIAHWMTLDHALALLFAGVCGATILLVLGCAMVAGRADDEIDEWEAQMMRDHERDHERDQTGGQP